METSSAVSDSPYNIQRCYVHLRLREVTYLLPCSMGHALHVIFAYALHWSYCTDDNTFIFLSFSLL